MELVLLLDLSVFRFGWLGGRVGGGFDRAETDTARVERQVTCKDVRGEERVV